MISRTSKQSYQRLSLVSSLKILLSLFRLLPGKGSGGMQGTPTRYPRAWPSGRKSGHGDPIPVTVAAVCPARWVSQTPSLASQTCPWRVLPLRWDVSRDRSDYNTSSAPWWYWQSSPRCLSGPCWELCSSWWGSICTKDCNFLHIYRHIKALNEFQVSLCFKLWSDFGNIILKYMNKYIK